MHSGIRPDKRATLRRSCQERIVSGPHDEIPTFQARFVESPLARAAASFRERSICTLIFWPFGDAFAVRVEITGWDQASEIRYPLLRLHTRLFWNERTSLDRSGSGAGLLLFRIVVHIAFLLCRRMFAVVRFMRRFWRKQQSKSSAITPMRQMAIAIKGNSGMA
jgi:hypothetical protein